MIPNDSQRPAALAAAGLSVVVVLLGLGWYGRQHTGADALVVYCAHDSLYSQQILDQFTEQTGIPVHIRFDTEATKSLGLVNLLIAERDHPRCDVFWNNQVLGTIELQQAGVLEPYRGSGFDRIPDAFKDPAGYWTGFAGRLRVFIVNTQALSATQTEVDHKLRGRDLSSIAIAQPMFGTTLSHITILWSIDDGHSVKAWHADAIARGLRVAAGNAAVKNLVASGACDLGWTDTDDYFLAQDRGLPVAMLPIRIDRVAESVNGDADAPDDKTSGRTICIPNSVCIVRGTQRRAAAERLVDFLLSAETELALARSRAKQIPLGPADESQLPADVQQLRHWAADSVDLKQAAAFRRPCLDWLETEYLQ